MTRFSRNGGYTLIELMIVVTIMSILASIIFPRAALVMDKATQSKTRSQLGLLRSTIGLYYSDNEGGIPFNRYPDGTAEANNISLTQVLVPRYIDKIPTAVVKDGMGFNGTALLYDEQSSNQMAYSPPREMILVAGAAGYHPFTIHPYVYDQTTGNIYINNGNRSTSGDFFFDW